MYNDYYRNVGYKNVGGDRLIPFAGPFLLGALTGGVAVGAFNPYRPRPYYPPRPYPPRPYPPYAPYGPYPGF